MKNTLTKAMLAASLITISAFTFANNFTNDSCQVEIETGLRINATSITVLNNEDDTLYKIINDEELIVNGETIPLNDNQQALVNEYSLSIRAVIPEIRGIAIDGIDLALDGVNLAFNELLGEGNDISTDLTRELSSLRDEIGNRLSIEHGIYINADGIETEDILGEDFENRIETVVEEAVMSSMGSLLVAVGQEMLFSGGDTDAFETRMESFGSRIEDEMETRAESFEQRADEICQSVVNIDETEEKMRAQISELSAINVITTESNNRNRM